MRRYAVVAVGLAVAVLLGLLALGLAGGDLGAGGRAPTPVAAPGHPVYLALGDSVAVGVGAESAGGNPGEVGQRGRADGYAGLFAEVVAEAVNCIPREVRRECGELQYVNDARSGATTASFLTDQLPAATALLRDSNGEGIRRDDVLVVTLTIGGNDVFGPVVEACLGGGTTVSPGCRAVVAGRLAVFAERYERILADLRAAAGPETVIVTTTYYNSLPACDLGRPPSPAGALADAVLEGSPSPGLPPEGINDVIRAASVRHGAVVADAYGVLRDPDHFVGGADCLHPNASGHHLLADLVAGAWRSARR